VSKLRWIPTIALLLASCVGGPGGPTSSSTGPVGAVSSTTVGPSTITTEAAATTSAPATTTGESPSTTAPALSEEAQACLDLVHDWITDIEDDVAAVDFATVGFHEYQLLLVQIVPGTQAMFDQFMELGCDQVDQEVLDPTSIDLIAWAEENAPGAVPYLEMQQVADDLDVVGDCISDVEALQAYVDGGGTVMDLTVRERIHAYNLAGSIIQWCSLEVGERFVSSAEVSAFLGIED
jgi:hypothetical protein